MCECVTDYQLLFFSTANIGMAQHGDSSDPYDVQSVEGESFTPEVPQIPKLHSNWHKPTQSWAFKCWNKW